jgi:hypothetical protein
MQEKVGETSLCGTDSIINRHTETCVECTGKKINTFSCKRVDRKQSVV